MGNKGRTEAGDVQVMSAGTGIKHSEFNLENETTRLFQIWILPTQPGGAPSWGAKPFPKSDRSGRFVTLASGFADDKDALPIRSEARVLGATVKAGERLTLALAANHYAYLVPATGAVELNGARVDTRDGAAIGNEKKIEILGLEDAEIVLVETA
jgi:redox-sensitive bicupin YhaK (pirin superfamily)